MAKSRCFRGRHTAPGWTQLRDNSMLGDERSLHIANTVQRCPSPRGRLSHTPPSPAFLISARLHAARSLRDSRGHDRFPSSPSPTRLRNLLTKRMAIKMKRPGASEAVTLPERQESREGPPRAGPWRREGPPAARGSPAAWQPPPGRAPHSQADNPARPDPRQSPSSRESEGSPAQPRRGESQGPLCVHRDVRVTADTYPERSRFHSFHRTPSNVRSFSLHV